MKTKLHNVILIPGVLAMLASVAPVRLNADVLADYPFVSGSAGSTDTNANSTAQDFIVSSYFGVLGGISSDSKTAYAQASGTPSDETSSFTDGAYFEFTVTPQSGYALDLSSLTFDTIFNGSDTWAAVQGSFVVRSSIDGFSTNISSTFVENYQTGASFTSRSVDLTGFEFQNITGSVDFRIYLYDNSTATGRYLRVGNVELNGTVNAIPEPSHAAFVLAIAAVAGLSLRRRIRG